MVVQPRARGLGSPAAYRCVAVWASTTVAKAAPQAGASTAELGIAPPGRQPAAASHALNAAISTSASTGPGSPNARRRSSWSMMLTTDYCTCQCHGRYVRTSVLPLERIEAWILVPRS